MIKKTRLSLIVSLLSAAGVNASYAAQNSDGAGDQLEEVVVTATASRLPESLDSFSGSVTQIGFEDLQSMKKVTNDLGAILGQSVPGLGAGSIGTASNFDQSLRGRKLAVLIDGIPIGTPLRDGRHDIRALSSNVLQTVEVIRGATAIYGNGGEGGSVNYITRQVGDADPVFRTEIGLSSSTDEVSEGLNSYIDQSGYGRLDNGLDYVFSLYYEQQGGQFDADGDRIKPSPNGQGGLADSDIRNIFVKLGKSWSDQRLEFTYLDYDQEQDSDYNGIIAGDAANGIKSQPSKAPLDPRATNEKNSNKLFNLTYAKEQLFSGTGIQVQYYAQDFNNIFSFSSFFPGDGQSQIEAEKEGLRIDFNSSLDGLRDGATVLWGFDILTDTTSQSLVDGRIWAPETELESRSFFAQLTLPLTDSLILNGGLRKEQADISFPGFTALFSGATVSPGNTDYDETIYNVGLNYAITDDHNIFVAYSEGFTVAEVGRLLRQADASTDFASAGLEAPVTENIEIGYRADLGDYSFSIAYYQSSSELGTSITNDLTLSRSKEEVDGLEITFSGAPSDVFRFGGTFTTTDGERDTNGDGSLDRKLASNRVGPDKLTVYAEYDFSSRVSSRVQALHSGSRDEFEVPTGFGERPIDSYTLVDLSVGIDMADMGDLSVGVQNVFNEDYFTLASQIFYNNTGDSRYSKGIGRVLKITYGYEF